MTAPESSPPESNDLSHSVLPLLLIIARRLRFLFFVPFSAAVIAVIYSLLSDPIYVATARILPPQYNENTVVAMQNQLGGESQLGNSALTLKNPTDLFVGILTSRTIVDAVIEQFDLADYYDQPIMGELRRKLARRTEIRAAKNGIVSISVEDTDRQIAADLANAYVQQFYAFSQGLARQQATRRSAFYNRALASAREQLVKADQALAAIEKETGYIGLQGQDQSIILAVAELQAQISAREIQLETMSAYATASNPDVQLIKREIRNLKRELASMSEFTTTKDTQIDKQLPDLSQAPDALLAFNQRKRDVVYWESIVDLIGRFSELGKIDESRDMSLFQVLDDAIPPYDKSKPRTKVNAILAFVGTGFLCLFWVLAGAYTRQRRTESSKFESQWRELIDVIREACWLGAKRDQAS